MALKHEGKLAEIRKGQGSERAHDFHAHNPSNKFDIEPIAPRSADQVRRIRTMGDGTPLRLGALSDPVPPPAPPAGSANPGPQHRRTH
jgi:hypothetical protein